jgi:hypothetical protein
MKSALLFTFLKSLLVAAVCCLLSDAHADTINIQVTDMEVTYLDDSGGAIFDAGSMNGGNLQTAEANLLNAVQYTFDGAAPPASGGNNVFVSNATTGIWGDLLIDDVGSSVPISNTTVATIGGGGAEFGFDLFSSTGGTSTSHLRLEFDTMNILLNSGVALIVGKANVVSQNLPFLLEFDENQQVDFAYTATGPGISGTATDASLFVAGGTINISGAGVIIPEPTGLAMFGTALGLAALSRRRLMGQRQVRHGRS